MAEGAELQVLLVEDDPGVAGRVRRALDRGGNGGFRTSVVDNPADALARMGQAGVVLLDLGIAGGDGLSVLRHLHEAAPDVPVVVLATSPDGPSLSDCIHCGAQQFLAIADANPGALVRSLLEARERQEFLREHDARLREEEGRRRHVEHLDALGRLAGGVAHDLNNVLTTVLAVSERLVLDPGDPGMVRSRARQLLAAGRRSAQVVEQLLDYGGREMPVPGSLSPGEVVSDLRQRMARLLREGIRVRLRIDRRAPRVLCDRRQLEHAVLTLVEHARDSMPSGGNITVSTSRAPGSEPHAVVAVADEGPGLDEEARRRLFEPYFSSRVLGVGSGLGLAPVHAIARQAGGYLEVNSTLGRGTTVLMALPAVDDDAPPEPGKPGTRMPAARGRAERPRFGGRTVLLVHRDDSLREVVSSDLARMGLLVVNARSPGDAVRLAAAHPGSIDLLVAEAAPPGLTGTSVAALVRQASPRVRVVLLASTPGEAAAVHRREAGAALLCLPFETGELSGMVERVLSE